MRYIRKITCWSFLLFLFPQFVVGQYTLSGIVEDAETGEKLPGAHILLEETGATAVSDASGAFFFPDLPGKSYTLEVSYLGYETEVRKIELTGDRSLVVRLKGKAILTEEVIVKASRVDETMPLTSTTLEREQIEANNVGQDLPFILQLTPSVVTTSDAGAGVGYTGIRIRGSDITRINVTMNGVPVNDPESHAVYFVNLPDLASSVENIQVQRGVGTSVNGAGAFGASINIQTTTLNPDPYGEINSIAGSFNTFKNTARFGTGLIGGKWAFDGRLSDIRSDGYIDRGWSDLSSFYLSGGYYGSKTIVKAIVTSGREKTYQAWWGTPKDSLPTNRTYNPSGEILDDNGNIVGYYDNQTDNYQQDYYQLHLAHKFSTSLDFTSTLFYTRGKGYFENYRNQDAYADYGFEDVVIGEDTITHTDLIRQKWLDNHFYGFNLSFIYSRDRWEATLGGGGNHYTGDHYGYIVWAEHSSNSFIDKPWYENTGDKTDFNIYGKVQYQVSPRFSLFGDVQYRGILYEIKGIHDNLRGLTQSHRFHFLNPKGGLYYSLDDHHSFFASVAVANREPNRNAYRDADPGQEISSEQLIDYEAGYQYQRENVNVELNGFYMDYHNQLVLTGQINNVGDPILVNVPESYRAGIEVVGGIRFVPSLRWEFNATWSQNKILNFVSYTDDWDTWPEQVTEDLGTTDISFSPDVTAGSNLAWEAIRDFEVSLLSNYVGRQYIDNTSNKNRSLDPYFVNNLRLHYTIRTNVIREIELMVRLNNIFNVEYEANAWVYRYYLGGEEYELNGYFPQAKFHWFAGVNLRF